MKKAIEMMQAMQNWLAQYEISATLTTTFGDFGRAVTMYVHDQNGVVAGVSYESFRADEFEDAWAEFEAKVKDHFFGWWE